MVVHALAILSIINIKGQEQKDLILYMQINICLYTLFRKKVKVSKNLRF